MTKLSTAQHLALNAVRNGRCYRRYNSEGNTLHNKDGGLDRRIKIVSNTC